jgi:hypothetical protein
VAYAKKEQIEFDAESVDTSALILHERPPQLKNNIDFVFVALILPASSLCLPPCLGAYSGLGELSSGAAR